MIKKLRVALLSILIIPFGVISCSSLPKSSYVANAIKPDGKVNVSMSQRDVFEEANLNDDDFNDADDGFGFGSITYLSNKKYNQIYRMIHEDEIGIVVIANHHIYKEFIKTDGSKTMLELISKTKIKYHTTVIDEFLGAWIGTFKTPGATNWMHGTSEDKNYGDFYPLFFVNHIYSQFGASNFHPEQRDLIEISYDHY